MHESSDKSQEPYLIVHPKIPIPGCLTVIVPVSQVGRLSEFEMERRLRRYIVRVIVTEHIPLDLPLEDILQRTSTSLLEVAEDDLSWHLHYGGMNAVRFELCRSATGVLSHITFEVETNWPLQAFAVARTYANELLDVMMRLVWMPLVVMRLDLLVKEDHSVIAHQCTLPYSNKINFQYGGTLDHYPVFRSYEALIREAVSATSPYYRFFCAYRLYDGVNALRKWMKDRAKQFSVQLPLPRDPKIDLRLLRDMGASEEFLKGIRTTNDLFSKLTLHRNQFAHFLLGNNSSPLNFSDGFSFEEYSFASAILLHYSHEAINSLWLYLVHNLATPLRRGSILPTEEQRDLFIIRANFEEHDK